MSTPRQSSSLLIDESPLQVLPSLAARIGLNEAIVLQQIHYWLSTSKHDYDGRYWIYNSIPQWQEQFPWWSEDTIGRTLLKLERMGLLLSGNYNTAGFDRTKWYTIDYVALEAKKAEPAPAPKSRKNADASPQVAATNTAESGDHHRNLRRPIPETNTETNNRESDAPATNGHISNGHSVGYDTAATQSKGARPLAEETPPPVTVKVPPGTPVNRRPDAPAVHAVPKPEKPAAHLARWKPPADFDAWYAETCAERGRDPAGIDLTAELQKFRAWPAHQALAPGQCYSYWQMWILRAFDGVGQPRPAPAPPPAAPLRYKTRKD